MARISLQNRLPIMAAHLGHYEQAEIINGSAFDLVQGYGRTQMQQQYDDYAEMLDELLQLNDTELPALRSERDDLFGVSSSDPDGVWMRLLQYKPFVKAQLGIRHPLARTIPNIGRVTPIRYLEIIDQFANHWTRVNAGLQTPLTIGAFTLANLQAVRTNLAAKIIAIRELEEADLPLKRNQAEDFFGDVSEQAREPGSIISRLVLYHAVIRARFPGQPIADSLPEIFPGEGETPNVGTFSYNWFTQQGGGIVVWHQMPEGSEAVAQIWLREGVAEMISPMTAQPGAWVSTYWSDVTVVGDLDEIELRDNEARTLAVGVRDTNITNPPTGM